MFSWSYPISWCVFFSTLEHGVLQGSILGPLFFTVNMQPLEHKVMLNLVSTLIISKHSCFFLKFCHDSDTDIVLPKVKLLILPRSYY